MRERIRESIDACAFARPPAAIEDLSVLVHGVRRATGGQVRRGARMEHAEVVSVVWLSGSQERDRLLGLAGRQLEERSGQR